MIELRFKTEDYVVHKIGWNSWRQPYFDSVFRVLEIERVGWLRGYVFDLVLVCGDGRIVRGDANNFRKLSPLELLAMQA